MSRSQPDRGSRLHRSAPDPAFSGMSHEMTNTSTESGSRRLTCVGCGSEFIWTAGDIDFYIQRDLKPPKRCKPCRYAKQQARAAAHAEGARVWE